MIARATTIARRTAAQARLLLRRGARPAAARLARHAGGGAHGAPTALEARDYPGAFTVGRTIYASTAKMRVQNGIVGLIGDMRDDERSVPFLIAAARHNPHRRVRASAMGALGRQPGSQDAILRELLAGLADPSYNVRAAAASALGRRADDRALSSQEGRLVVEGHVPVRSAIGTALEQIRSAD